MNIGDKFEYIEITSEVFKKPNKKYKYVKILCHKCKQCKDMRLDYVVRHGKSCGCLKYEKKIDTRKTDHPAYSVLRDMVQRCYNKNNRIYRIYGGRGITICDEWNPKINKEAYSNFIKWAEESGYEPGLTIDKINNNANYSPENCRWISIQDQQFNRNNNVRFTAYGETKTIKEWARDPRCAVKVSTFCSRISTHHWDFYDAFTKPKNYRHPKKRD